jgi:hypothetical protein
MYINTYLYIFTLSVYVSLLAGDQVRMNVCLLVRLFLLVIFFFLFAHSTQSVKHQVVLYIYIYVGNAHTLFHGERRGFEEREKERLFDNLFFSFFLFWLVANKQKRTYSM